ncbi:MAG: HD domain-containing protein [bacterium]|nr:HD domain-containing protein [bacterium]
MKIVSAEDLLDFKVLPYNLYDEMGNNLLEAGEIMTPGKLVMLKNYKTLYAEDDDAELRTEKDNSVNLSEAEVKQLADYTYEGLDLSEYETIINRVGALKSEIQMRVKYFAYKTYALFEKGLYIEGSIKLKQLVSILVTDVFKYLQKSSQGSKIRFMGEYEICHPLNVAIISGLIAKRLEFSNYDVEQIVLGALLHDVGKFKIHLGGGVSAITTLQEAAVKPHTTLGYDLILNDLQLSKKIARIALEHHENNDGSGYPNGLSNDNISEWSQIVNMANYYDNLACNRTQQYVECNHDVLRAMLEIGTKKFSARMLYTFIHYFSYDDSQRFDEIAL